jgi:hypothetical protein
MRNARTVWLAAIWFTVLGAGLSAIAKGPKAAPLVVTYYYLPG